MLKEIPFYKIVHSKNFPGLCITICEEFEHFVYARKFSWEMTLSELDIIALMLEERFPMLQCRLGDLLHNDLVHYICRYAEYNIIL